MKNSIYKIVVFLTAVLPISVYLFLSATIFQIHPDYMIYETKLTELTEFATDEGIFLYDENNIAIFSGKITYNETLGTYGILLKDDEILKIGLKYYSVKGDEIIDVKKFEIKKQQRYKIPITIFLSAFGVVLAGSLIFSKMKWHRKYPREATLIALIIVTAILFVINTFIASILGVFIVVTLSWAGYYVEYLFLSGKITKKAKTEIESEIEKSLKNIAEKYR